jgi:hypothetical protein
MSVEAVGARLLGEVKSETLDEVREMAPSDNVDLSRQILQLERF